MHYRLYSIYSLTALQCLHFNNLQKRHLRRAGVPEGSGAKSYCQVTRSISVPISSLYKPSFFPPTLQFGGIGPASLCFSTSYKIRAIHHLRAPYLVNLLQDAKLVAIGRRSSRDVLIDYYRLVTEEVARNWSNGKVRSKLSENNRATDRDLSRMRTRHFTPS